MVQVLCLEFATDEEILINSDEFAEINFIAAILRDSGVGGMGCYLSPQ